MYSPRKNFMNTLTLIALIMLQCSFAQDLETSNKLTTSFLQSGSELKDTFDKDWMKGFWIGKGYGCGGRTNIPEDINVEYVDGEFVATKVNGDPCVPSGNVTFRGKLPENWETNTRYPGTITLGNPANPASGKGTCKIVPVDKDKFRVENWNLEFIRGRLNPPEEPKKEEPKKEEPKKEEPKPVEEPKPIVVISTKPAPIIEEPKREKPCIQNCDDHLPRGRDDENVYTKHVDIVEKFRKAKNPYKRFPRLLENDDDDLILVPKKWLKVTEKLKENGKGNKKGRGNKKNNRKPRRDYEDEDDDEDDDDDDFEDRNLNDCHCPCRRNRRNRRAHLEN